MSNRWETGNSDRLIFLGSRIPADDDFSQKLKDAAPWKRSCDQPGQQTKEQRHYFANKCASGQSFGFSSGHVWMWELDYKESRVPKNWCFWTVVLEKTLESPLDCKEIQPVHSEEDQPWDFFGRNDAEAETPILWPLHAKSWLIGKALIWGLGTGGEGDDRGWDGWMASRTRWTWVWVDSESWWWKAWRAAIHGVTKSRTWLSDWTELNNALGTEDRLI